MTMKTWHPPPVTVLIFSGNDKARNENHGLIGDMPKLQKYSFVFQGSGYGVIQNTTTEVILKTFIAARDKALTIVGANNVNKLSIYGSDQTHSTFAKVCKSRHFSSKHKVDPDGTPWWILFIPFELMTVVETDVTPGLVSIYLCLNLETTLTTVVDLVEPLTLVMKGHEICIYVVVAYAGSDPRFWLVVMVVAE
ncbi:hypothetical protein GQ457_02G034720 [Hibiscus cannabinus]